jgi:hypothetical protein
MKKGQSHSPETRARMSVAHKGSDLGTEKIVR